jgi:hypothetical protein
MSQAATHLRGSATLSGAAIALLAGRPSLAAQDCPGAADTAADVRILNTALAAEREAIAAYQVAAESGLLRSSRWRCSSRAITRRTRDCSRKP